MQHRIGRARQIRRLKLNRLACLERQLELTDEGELDLQGTSASQAETRLGLFVFVLGATLVADAVERIGTGIRTADEPGLRRRQATEKQKRKGVARVGELNLAAIVRVGRVHAVRTGAAEKEETQSGETIAEVDRAVDVGVATAVCTRGRVAWL